MRAPSCSVPASRDAAPSPTPLRGTSRDAGVSVAGRIQAPATAEGGDLFWLDRSTLLAGRGYRTNAEGIAQLRALLGPSVDVIDFDLPHFRGPSECLHLLSFVSPLDVDLVVAYLPMVPVRLVEIFRDRDIRVVEVPEDEFASMGPNVLALGPRIALAIDGNPETRRRMEAAGVDVRTYVGTEISREGRRWSHLPYPSARARMSRPSSGIVQRHGLAMVVVPASRRRAHVRRCARRLDVRACIGSAASVTGSGSRN